MQTSKIKIGEKYAYRYNGEEVALYVTDMVTRKSATASKTTIDGWVENSEGRISVQNIKVDDIIDDFDKRQRLVAAEAERAAKAKVVQQARADKQWLVVETLAKAIGAQAVKDRYGSYRDKAKAWNQDEAAIIVDSSSVQINEPAFDALLEFLGRAAG